MASSAPASSFTSVDQRVCYGVGRNMAASIIRQGGLEIDIDAFMAGFKNGLSGGDPEISEADLEAAFADIQQRAQAAASQAAAAQAALGNSFLTTNKSKPGVTTTESGLQYEVITSGTGPKPKESDQVEVHYHGTLLDGSIFDSSVDRGETAKFPVTGVIRGWVEALQLMSVGDKWRLTIPSALAYGERATGSIPAGSVLIFEVELISILTPGTPAE
jgi:FKBP-type peptidyl-prolyl cis-trans isomerase FklB